MTVRGVMARLFDSRDWRGDCYEAAAKAMLDLHRAGLSEGARLMQGEPVGRGGIAGRRFGHAWVEVSGQVFDLTVSPRPMDPSNYYSLGQIETPRGYTFEQARGFMLDLEHYGPWAGPFAAGRAA